LCRASLRNIAGFFAEPVLGVQLFDSRVQSEHESIGKHIGSFRLVKETIHVHTATPANRLPEKLPLQTTEAPSNVQVVPGAEYFPAFKSFLKATKLS
jgi:hypothetical protein